MPIGNSACIIRAKKPPKTKILELTNFVLGGNHAFGIDSNNNLLVWGSNSYGELGLRNTDLTKHYVETQASNSSWLGASAGKNFSMHIRSDGSLYAYGLNNPSGQLGKDAASLKDTSIPTRIGTDTWTKIKCGVDFTLGVTKDNKLWGWGNNIDGRLGNKSFGNIETVPFNTGITNVNDMACGGSHSIILKSTGNIWGAGNNFLGQLGLGHTNKVSSSTQIGTSTWTKIACGTGHTLAIKSDGTLWTWGLNSYGALGFGDNTDRSSPTQIGTDTWTQIDCGSYHSAAIKSDGTLWTWGNNEYGQLGLGDKINRSVPVQVGTDLWSQVKCTRNNSTTDTTLANKLDNTLWGWGFNSGLTAGLLGYKSVYQDYITSPSKIKYLA